MPVICDSTCSAGTVTMLCTSSLDAPGNGMITFAIVTLICGSSSFGVTSTANSPSSNATERDQRRQLRVQERAGDVAGDAERGADAFIRRPSA